MHIIAINASPRKKGNTATILQHVLKGATDACKGDITTEILHLYSYSYTGCKSCYACKLKDGKSYGACAVKDDITQVLKDVSEADALVFGSPIFFGEANGMMRSFEERLLFPYLTYTEGHASIAPKKIPTAFVYTMNVTEKIMLEWKYPEHLKVMESYVGHIFGSQPDVLYVNNTVQFNNYSKYVCTMFSGEEKNKHKEEQFPKDCQKAEELGAKLVSKA